VTQSKFTGKVVLDMSISLDGFTAGPDISFENRLGINGERLHAWMFGEKSEADAEVDIFKTSGAVITGRRTFDMGEEPWGNDGAFGMPCFVLTHRPQDILVKGPTTFTFVTEGIESALAQAKTAAGEKDVWIMGAANIAHQYLRAGLVDEIIVHIVPVLLGAGSRLFDEIGSQPIELEQVRVIPSPQVTHIYYRVLKA
jgi:dihydrofolate reductase